MKAKHALLLAALLLAVTAANAQRLNVSYTFSTGVDSTRWIALDSTAESLIAINGTRSSARDIGFPFTYAGVVQTRFSVSKYGHLRFGNNLLPNTSLQYPLGNDRNRVTPGVIGLVGYSSVQIDSASYVRCQVVGDTGSRVLVVELRAKVMDTRYPAYNYALIQIQLHEASRAVSIVYGAQPNISLYNGYQLGFVGSSSDVAFIDVDTDSLIFADNTNQLNDTLSFPEQWRWYQIEYDSTYCYHYSTPWGEDFNTDYYLSCWNMLDYDNNAGAHWHLEGTHMRANFSTCSSNDWMVTPPIQLPTSNDGLRLMYDYKTSSNNSGACGKVQVRIAAYYPGDSLEVVDTADFNILRTETQHFSQFTQRGISLNAYAGRQIRIAFVTTGLGPNGQHVLIDNVRVEQTTTPFILLNAPERAFAYDSTMVTAELVEGAETRITYSWHSTMAANSMATTNAMGNQLSIVYTHYGTDTITCIATNTHGSDTTQAVVDVRDCTTVTEFPWMEDFEHGLDCWYPTGGNGNWTTHSGYSTPTIPACYEGSRVLRSSNGTYFIASQPIAVPTADRMPSPELIWWMRTPSTDTYSHNIFSLFIAPIDSTERPEFGPYLVFTDTLYYGPWRQYRVSLAPYAGQTIRFRFQNIPSHGAPDYYYDCVVIDQVEVRSTAAPMITLDNPLRLDRLDSNRYIAHLIEGDTAGMTFTWLSTMAANSLATFNDNDTILNISYLAEGTDTVTLIVSNNYGSDTATVIVPIYNCPALSLPFVADFEDSTTLSCWSGFTSNSSNEVRTAYGTPWYWAGDSSNHLMASNTYHSWLVTPAIDIPDDTTDLYISWHHTGTNMWVYVATGSDYFEPADFGTTLFSGDTGTPGSHRFSMAAFAGQRIHVGFFSAYSTGNQLDSVRIAYNNLPPQAALTAPSSSYARGRVALRATLNRCSQRGLTLSWHSSMAAASLARTTTSETRFNIYYLGGGIDTVTFIASNIYGSDTQQVVILVDACNAYAVPYSIDFDSLTGSAFNRPSLLPNCWSYMWNASDNYAPHVLTPQSNPFGLYPSQAALMMAGSQQGWDTVAYLVLPRFADSLYSLSLALTHTHEHVLHGTLTVGYMADTLFVPIQELPAVDGSGRRDTVNFANVPDSATHIALRWHNTYLWYSILVDDIDVFPASQEGLPPTIAMTAPDTAIVGTPALFTTRRLTGDTTGLTYSWHSTMAAHGMAHLSTSNAHLATTYTASGVDTVTAIATNPFGADTATAIVQVVAYYSVNAISAMGTMGIVSGSGTYLEGDTATLAAIAFEGFHFSHWNDGDTHAVRQIVVTADTLFTAYFESNLVYYSLTVASADSTMGTASGSGTYLVGDTVTITAAAFEGFHFTHWNDGDTLPIRQVVVNTDAIFTAYFEPDTSSLGIRQNTTNASQFAIHPNPTSGTVVISTPSLTAKLTVFDMAGRVLLTTTLHSQQSMLNLQLPSGTYFVRITTATSSCVKKLVVQR